MPEDIPRQENHLAFAFLGMRAEAKGKLAIIVLAVLAGALMALYAVQRP